jgi:uncharacterized protein YggE
MKRAFVLLAVLALPAAAAAQPVRPAMVPAMQTHATGITVSASGTERVTAASARITIQLAASRGAAALDAQRVQPIVDAMVAAGVDRSSIRLPLNFGGPGYATAAAITGSVNAPTVAMMQHGIDLVGEAIVKTPGIMLNGAMVVLQAPNCGAVQDRARAAAIASAKQKAREIARQVGVKLGGVLSVNVGEVPLQDGACQTQYYVGAFGPNMSGPGDYVTIPVTSTVTITYAIR